MKIEEGIVLRSALRELPTSPSPFIYSCETVLTSLAQQSKTETHGNRLGNRVVHGVLAQYSGLSTAQSCVVHGVKTMKCIKDGVSGEVRRVSDDKAAQKVQSYPAIWRYCPKHEWKKQSNVRG